MAASPQQRQQPLAASPLSPATPRSNNEDDDDMTEDEVALMVKNALRKARKAMASPPHQDDSDDDDDDDDESDDETVQEEDLARRIEEEIKGARAFAEKVYYGDGREPKDVDDDDDKGGRETSVVNSASITAVKQQRVVKEESDLVGRRSDNRDEQPPSLVRSPPSSSTASPPPSSPASAAAPPPSSPQQQQQPIQSPPRQHRQVVFRHPYPLPPPPILPRPDSDILADNAVKAPALRFKIAQPDADLSALIRAAADDSLVRRSNAVGAIKVLASKENNRAKLTRTDGLLDALLAACNDDAVDSDALDARTRAVTALLYLSEPKDNRLMVCRQPNLLDTLVKIVTEDTGEARLRACCCLATLAKTPQNRGLICNTDGLPGVLSGLMAEGAVVVATAENVNETTNGLAKHDNITKTDTHDESRDDSTMLQEEDDLSASFNSEDDDRMLTNTYSGTFSNGSGTFTEDFSDEEDDDDHSQGSMSDDHDGYSTEGLDAEDYSDTETVQEEEGVEMQISSLKKLNIENHGDFLQRSQLSACATLIHLTKHCANAPLLAQDAQMLENITLIASLLDNPLHTRCIEILCNLTRFPSNNARLASNPKVIDTLLTCGKSKTPEDRLWAIRTIQNLCSDASSKVILATGPILTMLSTSAMRRDHDEQYAAVGALMNLSTEPGSIVPLTNTKTVVATLVHLAHSPNTTGQVRKIACDSLATIGLWLQTLASAGTVPEEIPFSPLPTHTATGWLRWES